MQPASYKRIFTEELMEKTVINPLIESIAHPNSSSNFDYALQNGITPIINFYLLKSPQLAYVVASEAREKISNSIKILFEKSKVLMLAEGVFYSTLLPEVRAKILQDKSRSENDDSLLDYYGEKMSCKKNLSVFALKNWKYY